MTLAMPEQAGAADIQELRILALTLVNQERTARGLNPLKPDALLDEAAQRHAGDMLKRDYFAHSSPEGKNVLDRFIVAGGGRWQEVGENISRCAGCATHLRPEDVQVAQRSWMNSPGHRANILHPHMNRFGFGMVVGADGRQYAVQTFAGPGASRGAGPDGGMALDHKELQPLVMARLNRERQRLGLAPLAADGTLTAVAQQVADMLLTTGNDSLTIRAEDLKASIPPDQRQYWRVVSAGVMACGGCGSRPTDADIAYFQERWLADERHATLLRSSTFSHFGFALGMNGQGRKIAVVIFGRRV